ncbi:DnaJ C-terminal domain-containing protein [Methylocaldum sp. MU1018]
MEFKDYYKIMGVTRDASQEDIKRAYRKLARKYHPDVSKERNAEERFKELGEAYEVLKDPEKRAAYDQIATGRQHGERFTPPPDWGFDFDFGGGGFTGRDATGFSDFFDSLFGRATGRRRRESRSGWGGPLPGQDQYANIHISLEDAFSGGTQTVTLAIPEIDPQGRLVSKTRTLNVKIPKGIKEGQRIRLSGQGGSGLQGGAAGDLYLEIRFKPHRFFHAEGADILLELPITPWEAALGQTVIVPTLGGKVELKLLPSSQSGQKLRLKGRGLPGNPPGDQIVTLRLVTPEAATAEAKALYKRMAEIMPTNPRAHMGV